VTVVNVHIARCRCRCRCSGLALVGSIARTLPTQQHWQGALRPDWLELTGSLALESSSPLGLEWRPLPLPVAGPVKATGMGSAVTARGCHTHAHTLVQTTSWQLGTVVLWLLSAVPSVLINTIYKLQVNLSILPKY
jgi:hypothetical protein